MKNKRRVAAGQATAICASRKTHRRGFFRSTEIIPRLEVDWKSHGTTCLDPRFGRVSMFSGYRLDQWRPAMGLDNDCCRREETWFGFRRSQAVHAFLAI